MTIPCYEQRAAVLVAVQFGATQSKLTWYYGGSKFGNAAVQVDSMCDHAQVCVLVMDMRHALSCVELLLCCFQCQRHGCWRSVCVCAPKGCLWSVGSATCHF